MEIWLEVLQALGWGRRCKIFYNVKNISHKEELSHSNVANSASIEKHDVHTTLHRTLYETSRDSLLSRKDTEMDHNLLRYLASAHRLLQEYSPAERQEGHGHFLREIIHEEPWGVSQEEKRGDDIAGRRTAMAMARRHDREWWVCSESRSGWLSFRR